VGLNPSDPALEATVEMLSLRDFADLPGWMRFSHSGFFPVAIDNVRFNNCPAAIVVAM
jgi:hypothetical protein